MFWIAVIILVQLTFENDYSSAPFLHLTDKLVTVITLIGQNHPATPVEGFQQSLGNTDVIAVPAGEYKAQWIPKPIHYRMNLCC